MVEAKPVSVKAQTVKRVVAIAIFCVATNRMPDVCRMHPDLILTPGLKLKLNERMIGGTRQYVEMRHGILSTVVDW